MSSVDNLKKEAKRWLKALRAGDAAARARLTRAWSAAPDEPGLRDIQHALAREHGHESWAALKSAVEAAAPAPRSGPAPGTALVDRFLTYACWDHHTHGEADHRMYDIAAQRFLAQQPALARHDVYTAIVAGDIDEVRRILSARPGAAVEPGGSRGWTPILYSAFTRFTHPATLANGVAIARLLLDHGADPNDFYMAGDSQYSTLVGAAGEGEQNSPRQPYAADLYRLLLERGAEPYDIQVLYDTHFSADMIWWLELTYRHTIGQGRRADWADPAWSMLDMGGYGPGAYFVLNAAVAKNHLPLARWALEHGAGPNVMTSSHPKFKPGHTVYDTAVMQGLTEMAALLRHYGAVSSGAAPSPELAFVAACLALDRAAAKALIDEHPEFLQSPQAMAVAARRDRPDAIAFLVDLGVPLEIADAHNTRALHHAAGAGALRAAAFLVERGAEIDPRESQYGGTPIGWAAHGEQRAMMDFLSRHTRNVWTLTFRGYVDRLREILQDDPALAHQTDEEGNTPLWWLPDDEGKAMSAVEALLAAGVDPAATNHAGRTAADWARKRGMLDIARRLGFETDPGAEAAPQPPPDPATGEAAPLESSSRPIVLPPAEPADVPVEMRMPFPMHLYDGTVVPTTTVWRMLTAARDGDLATVTALAGETPSLVRCDYNYMPPLHLAIREGHLDIVTFLAERGAVNPKHRTYPYHEPLAMLAEDRGFTAIAGVLAEYGRDADPERAEDENGKIEYGRDGERHRFEQLVNANALGAVEALLDTRPELAVDPFAFWSEGVLMMPAHDNHRPMIELLMRYGATVPIMTKWGREYYFKHDDIAAFLLERGMDPNHLNCHRTSLLHSMAHAGDIGKATLLLDHGAAIDAVDDEFRSTPLGFAARWGRLEMVRLLLDRGADRDRAGAEWATPIAWARRKGHDAVAAALRR